MFNNFRRKEFGIREKREASWSSEMELLGLSLGGKKEQCCVLGGRKQLKDEGRAGAVDEGWEHQRFRAPWAWLLQYGVPRREA